MLRRRRRLAEVIAAAAIVGGVALASLEVWGQQKTAPQLGAVGSAGPGSPLPVWNQAGHIASVTPSDTADLAIFPTTGIFVAGTAGGAACVLVGVGWADGPGSGNSVTFSNLQPGSDHPYALRRIMATNTTCTGILAFYQ